MRRTLVAAVPPLRGGAAPFNAALAEALRARGALELVSWRRLYPPLLYPGEDEPRGEGPEFLLDWANPLSWRRALRRVAGALIVPWLHPVAAPVYRYLLRRAPAARIVICHNVLPHELVRGAARITRAVLRHADLLVTHGPQQREELRRLGLGAIPVLESFHPRFEVEPAPQRDGDGLELLTFGAVRPYKGVDLALEALALVDPSLSVRLTVAGRFWDGGRELRALAARLGLNGRLELRDGYVPDPAPLFAAADAALLPYRSASQSGVAQLAFAYGRPVIATRVGGLPAAVADGRDGILCEPEPRQLARAIERMARERRQLAAGVRAQAPERSFGRYAELLDEAIAETAR